MSKYDEPWAVQHTATQVGIRSDFGYFIAGLPVTATAYSARIVACVNACAGMEDPANDMKRLREALVLMCREFAANDLPYENEAYQRAINFLNSTWSKP